jgi:hypothetical protein
MDIKQVPAHTNNYGKDNTKKSGIVFHWIVGESADATFANPNRRASAHYSILSNGEIHQHVADEKVAWHAGNGLANVNYIGIEHAGGQLINGQRKKPTPECHEASAQLCAMLCRKHGFRLARPKPAFKHKEVSDKSTECCGTLDIDWIVNRTNQILNNPQQTMNPVLYKENNNLFVDIQNGGYVGKIKVERLDGPNVGSFIENILISRPNGGRGGALVTNMDKIRYKAIFPANSYSKEIHVTYDNREVIITPPASNQEVEALKKQVSDLTTSLNNANTRISELTNENTQLKQGIAENAKIREAVILINNTK